MAAQEALGAQVLKEKGQVGEAAGTVLPEEQRRERAIARRGPDQDPAIGKANQDRQLVYVADPVHAEQGKLAGHPLE